MEPFEVPITDVLDLHTFQPGEVPELLADYLQACIDAGLFSVRIIHGKGSGRLKQRVREILEKHPLVVSVADAPPEAGGWGATRVVLKPVDRDKI